jgi:RhtB (resistance to homoserine/threonine) family protein
MTELLAVVTITLLAVISPGPDFAMVSRNSLLVSRRAGVLTAIGIGGGVLVHVAYTMLGIGLLLQTTPWLFHGLKLIGAGYLVWLGVKMLRSRPQGEVTSLAKRAMRDTDALRIGFLTNALNPKTTIFIVSLFLQGVQPTTPVMVQLGYGAFISAAHIVWFALVALFFSAGAIRDGILHFRIWIDRIFGALLVGFGIVLLLATASR